MLKKITLISLFVIAFSFIMLEQSFSLGFELQLNKPFFSFGKYYYLDELDKEKSESFQIINLNSMHNSNDWKGWVPPFWMFQLYLGMIPKFHIHFGAAPFIYSTTYGDYFSNRNFDSMVGSDFQVGFVFLPKNIIMIDPFFSFGLASIKHVYNYESNESEDKVATQVGAGVMLRLNLSKLNRMTIDFGFRFYLSRIGDLTNYKRLSFAIPVGVSLRFGPMFK